MLFSQAMCFSYGWRSKKDGECRVFVEVKTIYGESIRFDLIFKTLDQELNSRVMNNEVRLFIHEHLMLVIQCQIQGFIEIGFVISMVTAELKRSSGF